MMISMCIYVSVYETKVRTELLDLRTRATCTSSSGLFQIQSPNAGTSLGSKRERLYL